MAAGRKLLRNIDLARESRGVRIAINHVPPDGFCQSVGYDLLDVRQVRGVTGHACYPEMRVVVETDEMHHQSNTDVVGLNLSEDQVAGASLSLHPCRVPRCSSLPEAGCVANDANVLRTEPGKTLDHDVGSGTGQWVEGWISRFVVEHRYRDNRPGRGDARPCRPPHRRNHQ